MEDRLLSRREAAQMLGVSHWTIARYGREGLLHEIKFNASNVRIRLSEIEALIAAKSAETKSAQ